MILVWTSQAVAQTKVITGKVKDSHSEEAIPFATLQLFRPAVSLVAYATVAGTELSPERVTLIEATPALSPTL